MTNILLTSPLIWCRRPELVAAAAEGAALVCALPLEEVAAFSSLRINLSQDLRGANQRRANLQVGLWEQVYGGMSVLGEGPRFLGCDLVFSLAQGVIVLFSTHGACFLMHACR